MPRQLTQQQHPRRYTRRRGGQSQLHDSYPNSPVSIDRLHTATERHASSPHKFFRGWATSPSTRITSVVPVWPYNLQAVAFLLDTRSSYCFIAPRYWSTCEIWIHLIQLVACPGVRSRWSLLPGQQSHCSWPPNRCGAITRVAISQSRGVVILMFGELIGMARVGIPCLART